MNIADPGLGLPAWIKELQEKNNDIQIDIHCGEGFLSNINYKDYIENILEANNMQLLKQNVAMHEVKDISASIIIRDNQQFGYCKDIQYDLDGRSNGLQSYLRELNIKIKEYYRTKEWVINYFVESSKEDVQQNIESTDMCNYVKLKYEVCQKTKLPFDSEQNTTLPFPPICCYDGGRGIEEKTIETLNQEYQQKIEQYKEKLIIYFTLAKITIRCCNSKFRGLLPTYEMLRKRFNEDYNKFKNKELERVK